MAAGQEHVTPGHLVDDPVLAVKQLVADVESRDDVLQVQSVWSSDNGRVGIVVVLSEFTWDVRAELIEMIDDVHRRHVDEITVEFDIVDRDHRPYAEFL